MVAETWSREGGFQVLPGGFLYVDEILQKPQFHKFTVEDVQAVVVSNDKQRFFLETEPDTGRLKIRANQGHSVHVPDLELEPVSSAEAFPVVVHGTYHKFWAAIQQQGLKRMSRTHVHFAAGEPGESGVISGMRNSCDIMIYLDLEKALSGGLKFFRSANNVILCAGNQDGVIEPTFFSKVVDRRTGKLLSIEEDSLVSAAHSPEESQAPSTAVSADDLADDLENQRKSRRKKKNPS
ncbi:hypothetical protein BaRGS_00026572 [Batillaria attramentaria]|uniref:2'-phosphotransferase n=1 Tax=Batillaria attramentaria TaxID=370345 RepID=A0ABD0K560_9CAEN